MLTSLIVSRVLASTEPGALLVALTIVGQIAIPGYLLRRLTILMNSPRGKSGWH